MTKEEGSFSKEKKEVALQASKKRGGQMKASEELQSQTHKLTNSSLSYNGHSAAFFPFHSTSRIQMTDKKIDMRSKVVPEEMVAKGATDSSPSSLSTSTTSTSTTSTKTTTTLAPAAPASYPQPRLSVDLSSTLNQHASPATIRDDDESETADGTIKPIRKLKALRRHILHPRTKRQKAVCGIFWIVLIAAAVCFLIWGLPPLTKKVLVPLLEKVKEKMSRPAIAGEKKKKGFFQFFFDKC